MCSISVFAFFRNGYFFLAYDLSTSAKCSSSYVVPTIRVGHLRFYVQFNAAMPVDLTMLVFCEYPSTLYLNKDSSKPTFKTGQSYTPR
jgi:hypothetical protein